MNAPHIVLASSSRYRKELLERLGLRVEAVAPDLDERAVEQALGPATTEEVTRMLSLRKARTLAGRFPDALIIGADQIAEVSGERLHKPVTAENAHAQLKRLTGRTHRLVTAVTVLRAKDMHGESMVDVHKLTMRKLSDKAIQAYVAREKPLDCAGSYKIEALGIALFERIEGADFTAIQGLSLIQVATLLGRFGVDVLADK